MQVVAEERKTVYEGAAGFLWVCTRERGSEEDRLNPV